MGTVRRHAGAHCPRAGSPRPGTGLLWSTAESCAFTTVCARPPGRSPCPVAPGCGSSSPPRGRSCGVGPGKAVKHWGEWAQASLSTRGTAPPSSLTSCLRGWAVLADHLRSPFQHRRPPQTEGNRHGWGKHKQAAHHHRATGVGTTLGPKLGVRQQSRAHVGHVWVLSVWAAGPHLLPSSARHCGSLSCSSWTDTARRPLGAASRGVARRLSAKAAGDGIRKSGCPRGTQESPPVVLGVPSVPERGDAGRGVPAAGSPPWLTRRGGALLPGRGRLLLQASRHAGCPLCSGPAEQRRGCCCCCSQLGPGSSAFSCRPSAFQAGLGSAALRRATSAGKSGATSPRPHGGLPGFLDQGWEALKGGWEALPTWFKHEPTYLWTRSACGPSGRAGSPQSCPRCPLQTQAGGRLQYTQATPCHQPPGLQGGGTHGWRRCGPSPSDPAFLISLSLLCKGKKKDGEGLGGLRRDRQPT